MSSKLALAQRLIRSFDLFGRPVGLAYKGQRTFTTLIGGCVSLVLVLSIIIGAIVRFRQIYYYPEFQALPAEINFRKENLTLDFSVNTVAVSVFVADSNQNYTQAYSNTKNRVSFEHYKNGSSYRINAVYSEDFYAKQIAKEKSGQVQSNDCFHNS